MTFKLSDLENHRGSGTFYRHGLMRNVVYTEGVRALAEGAGAYWLIDKVATNQMEPKIAREDFQVWELYHKGNNHWMLMSDDGNGNVLHSELIEYSDFPLPIGPEPFKLYCVRGEARTIMLPGEY